MTSRPPLTLVPPPDTAPPGDTVTRLDTGAARASGTTRYVGPDVVRAVALIGVVVMNYHGYLILRGGRNDRATSGDASSTRGPGRCRRASPPRSCSWPASASPCSPTARLAQPATAAAVAAKRWTLLRRGLALYAFGLMFNEIWNGTILPYYGAMFVVSAAIFTLATPWIVDDRHRRRTRRRRDRVVGDRAGVRRPPHVVADDRRRRVRRVGWCSTCSSTAPIRCCRGSPSSAPASSSADRCARRGGDRSPSCSA